jgi:bifunctional non-homologous end joining protein LigD
MKEQNIGCFKSFEKFAAKEAAMPKPSYLEVKGKRVKVSNLEKVFYPETGFTKADVIDYYNRISPVLLPHLKNRPISLKRYPDGVDGFFFYEKQCPSHRPEWIDTARVPSQRRKGFIDYCVMNDESALIWAANLADLELHTFLHRAPELEHPDFLAFDLDPGAPADLINCCEVALLLKTFLDRFDLQSFAKTSGSKGLQVYVPLNTKATYDTTKAFARTLAEHLESENPDSVTSKMQKNLRAGKVFVDWSQNDEHKTTVCVYSLRAKEHPTVSTPVSWKEVADTAKDGDSGLLSFEAGEVLRRVKRKGDLFAPVLTLKQRLPNLPITTANFHIRSRTSARKRPSRPTHAAD